ncbi:MAG: sugar ABC transporter ATP-binding protein [Rhizobiales bacterium]|nr:sugar ABC transporter ATP-binding protein [Hyphomicrobiales bacterium]MDQ3561324.1 sugar ABC transporter ATP-binding protein [Pseudomonadota bacterium]
MPTFLELNGISKVFGGVHALRDVDMAVEAGEVHCLVGENGSGKSTLIKIISGVQPPERGGRIVIEGTPHDRLTPGESTRLGIQVIYQDLSLFPNLTVAENIAVGGHLGRPRLVDWGKVRDTANRAMALIGVSLDLDARVASLPVASRQLVAICRAMAADARLVIMDEPTSSLTRHEVDALLALVADLKARGIAIMFVSHRLNEVLEVAERVTVLRDGRKVGTFPAAEVDDRKLAALMTGKSFSYELSENPTGDLPVALSVENLTRKGEYEDASFEVRAGEILGITGLLGSGRTELALSLFGMTRPDSGAIRVDGEPVSFRAPHDAIEHGIAYVSEDRLSLGLVLDQPISSNIVVTVMNKLAGPLGLVDPKLRRRTVEKWVRELAIKVSDPENPVKTLSGGNQQRVVLAKWMARQPRVLILDSPTVGVDINAKDGIYETVRRLASEGIAVIMISDEISEVLYHSHRVLVMRDGRITGDYVPFRSSEQELTAAVNA